MKHGSDSPTASISAYPAGLGRRLSALVYDGLLVVAIWMATLFVLVAGTDGEAKTGVWVQALLLIEWLAFYAFFLSRGQTLGMRAWRLQLVDEQGRQPGLGQVSVRLLVGAASGLLLGLGWLWMLIGSARKTWHDLASHTLIVVLPKPESGPHRSGKARQKV